MFLYFDKRAWYRTIFDPMCIGSRREGMSGIVRYMPHALALSGIVVQHRAIRYADFVFSPRQ